MDRLSAHADPDHCGGSFARARCSWASRDLGASVVEHHLAAFGDEAAKGYGISVSPHLCAQRFTGINGRGKTNLHRSEARRIVIAVRLHKSTPRHAEGAQPVQYR